MHVCVCAANCVGEGSPAEAVGGCGDRMSCQRVLVWGLVLKGRDGCEVRDTGGSWRGRRVVKGKKSPVGGVRELVRYETSSFASDCDIELSRLRNAQVIGCLLTLCWL